MAWGTADLEARRWLGRKLEAAGLTVQVDAALNVFGRTANARRPRLLVGSHTDSVPAGGRLDGAFGVVAALEVVRTLAEAGDPAVGHVELVDFADEEGVRFPCGYFGAKALTGALNVDALAAATNAKEVLSRAGVDIGSVTTARGHLPDVAGYLELHIEQGPRLEAEGLGLAVVPGILGFDRYRITIEGRSAHGGTTPFELRHDPVRAAAVFIAEVPAIVRAVDEAGVATVGNASSDGGAINFVAQKVAFTLEVRQPAIDALARAVDALQARLREVCRANECQASMTRHDLVAEAKDGVRLAVEPAFAAPVAFDTRLVDAVEAACVEAGVAHRRMHAGTWHDAAILARHVPAAMMLVASRGGVTHSPAEATSDADLVDGARVLLRAARNAVRVLGLLDT